MRVRTSRPHQKYLYDGALRLLDESDLQWLVGWELGFQAPAPQLEMFAGDAFCALYGVDGGGEVSIFWTETGEVESLGISEREFYSLIGQDPNSTINHSLYLEAVERYGRPTDTQTFALKVESALGGRVVVDNLHVTGLHERMISLGKLAKQIEFHALGTPYQIDK